MATKTIYNYRIIIPQLIDFKKKYYFLITSLLFEYEENSYYENRLEIFNFSNEEAEVLCNTFPFFYQEDNTINVDNFDTSLIAQMIYLLPPEGKEFLVDHMILSSIDMSSTIEDMKNNLKNNLYNFGTNFPSEYFSSIDFANFFTNKDSEFMNEYYPSQESKDEILLRYGLKK